MIYEVVQSEDEGMWAVEDIDTASEGEIYRAIFIGPLAESRANEYAAWKNGQTVDTKPAQ